ncbi:MAG: DUF4388 domain-containing protein [Thermoanaerobaculales bacterium]
MSATLAGLKLEELLPHLAERRATGTLAIVSQQIRKRLYLVDGMLAGSNSTNPCELLGHFLVGWGLIDEEKLHEAMELQDRLGTLLGSILERTRAIDAESLHRALQAQAEETLLDLFILPSAEKRFLENTIPADRPLILRQALQPLVLEGVGRRKRLAELQAVLGSMAAVPSRTAAPAPEVDTARERHILAEIDGVRDIEAIALVCHLASFHVAEFVARGVTQGFLELSRRGQQLTAQSPAELLANAEVALGGGDLRRCFLDLKRLRALPIDQAAGERARELERGVAEALAQRRIAGDLIPRVLAEPGSGASVGLAPAEMFVLSRIDAGRSLREIGRITPLEELHFGVVISTLLEHRLIELRHPKGGPAVE